MDLLKIFRTVDKDNSGYINADELKSALVTAKGKKFSRSACELMIQMFDRDKNGEIDLKEFEQLYSYINDWLKMFRTYDKNISGHIEAEELTQALQQMGFNLSPAFVDFIIRKSDQEEHKAISIDQFIVFCVYLQKFTECFKQKDLQMKGIITISFEDFLNILFKMLPAL